MIYLFNKIYSIVLTILYKINYANKLFINPLRSQLVGRLFISGRSASVTVKNGFRSKGLLNINVNDGQIHIGSNVFFNRNVSINSRNSIIIGNNCLFGENICIYDHDHNFKMLALVREQGFSCDTVKIGNNVWIGSGCIILKGAIIGDNSVIAAGSIVKGNVDCNSLFYQRRESVNVLINKGV